VKVPAARSLAAPRHQPGRSRRVTSWQSASMLILAGLLFGALLSACSSSSKPQVSRKPGTSKAPATAPAPKKKPSSTSKEPAGAPTPPGQSTTPSSVLSRCRSANLALTMGSQSAAAGSASAVFVLTNEGSSSCSLYGYPGMQMLDASGQPIPTIVVRGGGDAATRAKPSSVVLQPQAQASFVAYWGEVPVGAETSCPASAKLEVTAPDDYHYLVIAATLAPCSSGTINVSPVQSGVLRAGV